MNIKSIANSLLSIDRVQSVGSREVKSSESDKDRDADGRRHEGSQQHHKHMTPEELQEAVENIKKLEGVKKNRLTVELQGEEGQLAVVVIKDLQGVLVKRISEIDLWSFLEKKTESTGQLFNKAM